MGNGDVRGGEVGKREAGETAPAREKRKNTKISAENVDCFFSGSAGPVYLMCKQRVQFLQNVWCI